MNKEQEGQLIVDKLKGDYTHFRLKNDMPIGTHAHIIKVAEDRWIVTGPHIEIL